MVHNNNSRTRDMVNNTVHNNRTMELETHLVQIRINSRRLKIKDIIKVTNNKIRECSSNSNSLNTNNRTPNYKVKAHSMLLEGNRISK